MTQTLDIVALGEAMVEFNQVRDSTGRTYLQGFGGDTSNTVIAASRQGAACAYISAVGADDFGTLCCDLWRSEGVDITGVQVNPDAPTGIYFVRHDAKGHRFSYLRKGSAASRMTPADLPMALLSRAKYLHVSGISQAISESARQSVAAAIAAARVHGVRVSYDPNLRLSLWPLTLASAALEETLPLCDEFLPGLDDMSHLAGLTDPGAIVDWAHQHGAPVVLLKMGDQGVLVSDGLRQERIAAYRVDAVDATGAGDCFDGSYLARRAAGDDVFASARWAVAAAALSTLGYGAVEPLPNAAQVSAFRATQPA